MLDAGGMMHKTQLYLENHQYVLLKDWATRQGKSIAQVVRDLIEAALKAPEKSARDSLYDIIGMADSGLTNIGQNVDDYLYGDPETVARLEREGMVRDAPARRKKGRAG
jgi:hypothetical protein